MNCRTNEILTLVLFKVPVFKITEFWVKRCSVQTAADPTFSTTVSTTVWPAGATGWVTSLWLKSRTSDDLRERLTLGQIIRGWLEDIKVPQHCLKLERWQGPPHINTVTQYKLCCSFSLVSVCWTVATRSLSSLSFSKRYYTQRKETQTDTMDARGNCTVL